MSRYSSSDWSISWTIIAIVFAILAIAGTCSAYKDCAAKGGHLIKGAIEFVCIRDVQVVP